MRGATRSGLPSFHGIGGTVAFVGMRACSWASCVASIWFDAKSANPSLPSCRVMSTSLASAPLVTEIPGITRRPFDCRSSVSAPLEKSVRLLV